MGVMGFLQPAYVLTIYEHGMFYYFLSQGYSYIMKVVVQVFLDCLRYIVESKMTLVSKVLMGMAMLLLFYFMVYGMKYLDLSIKDFGDAYTQFYSCTREYEEVCILWICIVMIYFLVILNVREII
jgi:hypothetical protein